MPIAYLDVPTGADLDTKRALVKEMYDALHEAWPFPDDTRIFIREWPLDSVSQNGRLGSEPARPACIAHIPQGADLDIKRTVLKKINAAVDRAYRLPDFTMFLHEHSLNTVVLNGQILADDQQRAEAQREVYG